MSSDTFVYDSTVSPNVLITDVTVNSNSMSVNWLWANSINPLTNNNNYDNDTRLNYSVGFDYIVSNLGNFISQIQNNCNIIH